MLFLTENYAALDILKTPKYLQLDPLLNEASKTKSDHPFILFGSSFPKDREYTQVGYLTTYVVFYSPKKFVIEGYE